MAVKMVMIISMMLQEMKAREATAKKEGGGGRRPIISTNQMFPKSQNWVDPFGGHLVSQHKPNSEYKQKTVKGDGARQPRDGSPPHSTVSSHVDISAS